MPIWVRAESYQVLFLTTILAMRRSKSVQNYLYHFVVSFCCIHLSFLFSQASLALQMETLEGLAASAVLIDSHAGKGQQDQQHSSNFDIWKDSRLNLSWFLGHQEQLTLPTLWLWHEAKAAKKLHSLSFTWRVEEIFCRFATLVY